ncbi:hypothetical protein N7462_001739 [Penicillium macrosclerotiorum]|uniref:uncharacterized protein n=1 Tax=Penicillium macrosclerotiorum TaxID=303699 RepID=UPI0025479609|nr:uncharacterized protein N7462_001739 [Penicillium macrosclerotiorum]KAJ5692316.1 hypothetical protein N7462_001739 [Penicillium macrosclerotiorum]
MEETKLPSLNFNGRDFDSLIGDVKSGDDTSDLSEISIEAPFKFSEVTTSSPPNQNLSSDVYDPFSTPDQGKTRKDGREEVKVRVSSKEEERPDAIMVPKMKDTLEMKRLNSPDGKGPNFESSGVSEIPEDANFGEINMINQREITPSELQYHSPSAPRVTVSVSPKTGLAEISEVDMKDPRNGELTTFFSPQDNKLFGFWSLSQNKKPFPETLWPEVHKYEMQPTSSQLPFHRYLSHTNYGDSQVFDEDGDEHFYVTYQMVTGQDSISRRRKIQTYYICVVFFENGPPKFVKDVPKATCFQKRIRENQWYHELGGSVDGKYLVAWSSERGCFEKRICAVRVWNSLGTRLSFDKRMFDHAAKISKESRISPCDENSVHTDEKSRKRSSTSVVTKSNGKAAVNFELSPSLALHPSKKIKMEQYADEISPFSKPTATLLFGEPEIKFKFISETSNSVRVIKVHGNDIESVFKKAREFYKEMDLPSELALLCKVPGMEGQRFIGEGCQDELDSLCDDIKQLSLGKEKFFTVNVTPAGVQ